MSHKKHRMYNTSGNQNRGSHVFSLNDEFTNQIPTYFLDSGVVIAFSLVKLLEDIGFNSAQIKLALIRGARDTVNGGEAIEGNPHNIDMPTAEVLYDLYTKNKKCVLNFKHA